jgi:hypothetical membrane protein
MNRRYLSLCGMIAPILFIITVILGAAMRPGYSHLADTISELFSPGSPNKLLLDSLHTLYAILLTLFGIGILSFVRGIESSRLLGTTGAYLYIAMGILSGFSATIFPQDPWGSPPTFPGQMHIAIHGFISILSMLAMVMIGIWFNRKKLLPGFGTYSFVTVVLALITAGFFAANMGTPIMGLTERVPALIGFLWTFILARFLYLMSGDSPKAKHES